MVDLEDIRKHKIGEPFQRKGYNNANLTEFVHLLRTRSDVNFTLRTWHRAKDLNLTLEEVDIAVATGNVVAHEVGPSKSEIRMEIQGTSGDAASYCMVVWLSMQHNLFAEDIREVK